MSEIVDFIRQCLASGGLLLAFAATLALPLVAWWLTRPALALLRGAGAPRARGLVFAALATMPGITFAIGTATIVVAGYRAGCLEWAGGRAIVATILALFTCFAVRALLRARRLHAEVRSLRASSHAPEPRLALAARRAGLEALQVVSDRAVLCLVGVRRPVVLVSDAALARLGDGELDASLAHERAHARHRDPLLMAVVAFCADLFPMPVDDLVERYRIAREFAADRAALATVDALDLAQAMYRLALPRTAAAGAALADRGVAARVRALLEPHHADDRRIVRDLSLLVTGQGIVALSLVALLLPLATCRMVL